MRLMSRSKPSPSKGRFTTPKSKTSRRLIELGPRTKQLLAEHWQATAYNTDDDLVFAHPQKGTPLDPARLGREHLKPALKKAGITKPFRPFHDLRHTALTHEAAAGNPMAYLQQKAGHSQSTITERYIHAAQTQFPGATQRGEARLFPTLPRNTAGDDVAKLGERATKTAAERRKPGDRVSRHPGSRRGLACSEPILDCITPR